jgi:DNA-binding MarR family transcriptional regulator
MTNTINKLDLMGFVHVRPDWDDARRKLVSISGAGRAARDEAVRKITPLVNQMVEDVGHDKISRTLPILREMRQKLADD